MLNFGLYLSLSLYAIIFAGDKTYYKKEISIHH